jgi:hypothetical protein
MLLNITINLPEIILDIATDQCWFHRLTGKGAQFCTSLHAEDAGIFMASITQDISSLPKPSTIFAMSPV